MSRKCPTSSSVAKVHSVLVASFVHLPWDTDGNQPKSVSLTVPTAANPESGAWDILASELDLKTRQTFRDEHEGVDNYANIFVGTDDVETEIYRFGVWEESYNDEIVLEFSFSAYIQGDEEYWCVTLNHHHDIALLQTLLKSRNLPVEIYADDTLVTLQLEDMNKRNRALQDRLHTTLELLTGFEDTHALKNWHMLPPVPTGWGLLRILRGWVNHGQFDYTQVEFVLWMLKDRSQKVCQYLAKEDMKLSKRIKDGLKKTRNSEFAGFRGSPAHGRASPNFLKWKARHRELEMELEWLTTKSNSRVK